MDVDLTNPIFYVSLVIGSVILAAASFVQQRQGEEEQEVKPKAVLRDGILGAIFTAMAWTLVPDSMKHMSESVVSTVSSATTAAATSATTALNSGGGSMDIDLQVGPARF